MSSWPSWTSATKIELGFPHDFLTNDFVRQMVFGGTHASIDNHRA